MTPFSFDALRRWPDPEADNLFAVDAADRLILDEAGAALEASAPGEVVVIGDQYGALTLGGAALHGVEGVRVHQDALSGERALAANAASLGVETYDSLPLDATLLGGAQVVLLRLPRSLDALDEIAGLIATHAAADVTVYAGGMIKHLALAMNEVLGRHFGEVRPGLARQKARVLTVTGSRGDPSALRDGCKATSSGQAGSGNEEWPRREFHEEFGLWVCAHGGAFAGTRVDIGTRLLLEVLGEAKPDAASAIDLGCGTGLLAAALAKARSAISVIATDQSAAAVASARATMEANGLGDRVTVVRDDGLASQPDASAELILLNPPFHIGATVHSGIAPRLFEDAARVLAPGGELWTVFNSHLGYRPALERIVGPTRQIARNAKFTVTASTRSLSIRPAGE
ncbi:class I SAM-dependent methyltransferase [Parafrigoribacterium soli]|uniref:class I SAM-dependent methyltransferase n=1 Tax=Parafrigoribacterium soli TaxID=3144663 RepID=UPI0032EB5CE2